MFILPAYFDYDCRSSKKAESTKYGSNLALSLNMFDKRPTITTEDLMYLPEVAYQLGIDTVQQGHLFKYSGCNTKWKIPGRFNFLGLFEKHTER